MIVFSHPNIKNNLVLRLSPLSVQWGYTLRTNVEDTYGGQVVQILGINFENLILTGRFGKEGPHGKESDGNGLLESRAVGQQWWNYSSAESKQRYAIGLSQMTAWFQNYFTIASQGDPSRPDLHYVQPPVKITYDGAIDDRSFPAGERQWTVYPSDFPSYNRSLDNFAPQWQLECIIEETDPLISTMTIQSELSKLRSGVGYTQYWEFSDPLRSILGPGKISEQQYAKKEIAYNSQMDKVFGFFGEWLPQYTPEDYANLVLSNSAIPQLFAGNTPIATSTSAYVPSVGGLGSGFQH